MTIIEPSNFHSEIQKYCSENSLDICENDIVIKMIISGYSFSNIPPSRIKRGLAELRVNYTKGGHKESVTIIMNCLNPCPYCQQLEEKEEEEYNMNSDSDSE